MATKKPSKTPKAPKRPATPKAPVRLPFDPLTATDEQIKLWQVRENLARYGTSYAPGDAPAPVIATVTRILGGKRKPRAIDPKWFNTTKVCSLCGLEKNVGREFGIAVRRGVEYSQSRCRSCRSSENYRNKPRKNRTKNNPLGES